MKKLVPSILLLSLYGLVNAQSGNARIDYSAPHNAPFTAEEVTVPAGAYTLAGTLLLPKNPKRRLPAVINITGSGQQTRDDRCDRLPKLWQVEASRCCASTIAAWAAPVDWMGS